MSSTELGCLTMTRSPQVPTLSQQAVTFPFLMSFATRGAQGLVQAVGVSNYGPRQLERIHAYLERKGVPLASAQVRRLLCRRACTPRDVAGHGVLD